MSATDVKPSRLAAALAAARTFLDVAPKRYSVGIVSFSTRASLMLSPTTDRDAARRALDQIPLGSGTALGDAIDRSVAAARPSAAGSSRRRRAPLPATVLLLSDGEQTSGSRQPARCGGAGAKKLGVPVNTVALGTRDAVVEVPLPNGLKEQVTVAPDTRTLREIARDHRRPVRGRADGRAAEAGLSRSRQQDRQEARGA